MPINGELIEPAVISGYAVEYYAAVKKERSAYKRVPEKPPSRWPSAPYSDKRDQGFTQTTRSKIKSKCSKGSSVL